MSVKIKRLEWKKKSLWWIAETPLGMFDVHENKNVSIGCFSPMIGSANQLITEKGEKTVDAAKAACQRWFERLVMDCLEADNDPE
jgi:hypothetical protein